MKKVLVVDDSRTVREQVVQALAPSGFVVLEAADGEEGLAKLEADSSIALVILDLNMPGMNGLQLLERIKAGGQNPALHVIMLTTEGQQSFVERAKRGGAKGWIMKPFNANLLAGAVRKLLA